MRTKAPSGEPVTISVREAARLLGISVPHAHRLARAGELPIVRLGHRHLVPKVAIDRLLEKAMDEATLTRRAAAR